MTKTPMINVTWTLDAEGRLKATWITPPAVKPAAPLARFSRASALAAHFRRQAHTRRAA